MRQFALLAVLLLAGCVPPPRQELPPGPTPGITTALNAHVPPFARWPYQPFSREAHRAFIDANMALLDRARFAEGARAGNTTVVYPRSRNHHAQPDCWSLATAAPPSDLIYHC